MKFNKPPLDLSRQLQLWQSRGLAVADPATALHYLQFIGYYRLSAYALPFQDLAHPDKHFRSGTTFEQVLSLYSFDRELRLLVMDAIERVEVAVRSAVMNHMCMRYGSHWFMEARHFRPPPASRGSKGFSHVRFLDKIDDELGISRNAKTPSHPHSEVFVNHYFGKYTDPYLPPAWMVFEVISMGTLSLVFSHLKNSGDRAAIAKPFGVDERVLGSWLHCLSYVRNFCAHHSRLWNRRLVIKPIIARIHSPILKDNDRIYAVAFILHYLLGIVAPLSTWQDRLRTLLELQPVPDLRAMGFPPNWSNEPFWNTRPRVSQTT